MYGLQLADAHVRSGLARNVLLVGAEVHTAFMPYGEASWARLAGAVDTPMPQDEWDFNTQVRHLAVLFGDGAAAVIVQAYEGEDRGVIDHLIGADGTEFRRLWIPSVGTRYRPYMDEGILERREQWPQMDGRYVFKMATTKMAEVTQQILQRNGVRPEDLSIVLMHQANRRINEYVQKLLGLPDTQGHPQHPEIRQHDGGDHPAAVGRSGADRPDQARRPRAVRGLRRRDELGREPPARLIGPSGPFVSDMTGQSATICPFAVPVCPSTGSSLVAPQSSRTMGCPSRCPSPDGEGLACPPRGRSGRRTHARSAQVRREGFQLGRKRPLVRAPAPLSHRPQPVVHAAPGPTGRS